MNVLLVVYDYGSVSPIKLAEVAADSDCELVFVNSGSRHSQEMVSVLEYFGRVIDARNQSDTGLADRLSDYAPDGIVTFSEFQIPFTAHLASELGLKYHSLEDIDSIIRKDAQRSRLRAAGIEGPRYVVVSDLEAIDDAVKYIGPPLVIKPLVGASSRNTVLATDANTSRRMLRAFLTKSGDVSRRETALIVEELLVGRHVDWPWGDYIAVDCLSSGGSVLPMFVTGKFALARPLRERGGYARARVDAGELEDILALAVRAVQALNITQGVTDVEIKLTDAGPRVIEVNGRLGGWVDDLATRSQGFSPASLALRSALGLECQIPEAGAPADIAFQYLVIPPKWARRVRAISSASTVRRLAGVDRVELHAQAGTSVGWRLGTASSVAAITGMTASHDELSYVIDTIEKTRWIEYE